MKKDEKIMWYVIGGLILFWLVAIPVMAKSKPLGE